MQGKGQRSPTDEEHFYHVVSTKELCQPQLWFHSACWLQYGAPPSKKQVKEREGLIAGGKPLGAHESKEIRTVGLLKLIRNLAVHGPQMVNAGRFESEEALHRYLLEPFPWLLMACVCPILSQSAAAHGHCCPGFSPRTSSTA